MSENKWDRFWGRRDWTPGKEEEESRRHLANFFDALTDDVKSGAMFKRGALSIKNLALPNGYTVSFTIKQGAKQNKRRENT